ncbi:hypothetical protein ESCO106041_24700 [Escherichia coli]
MREVNYEALREAAQNYQSTLAWYQAIPDSPNAERDCDAALAAFKRHIRHRKRILSLICWMDWKKQNHNSTSSVSITKALSLMGASVLLNWKRGKFNYRLATTFDMDTR